MVLCDGLSDMQYLQFNSNSRHWTSLTSIKTIQINKNSTPVLNHEQHLLQQKVYTSTYFFYCSYQYDDIDTDIFPIKNYFSYQNQMWSKACVSQLPYPLGKGNSWQITLPKNTNHSSHMLSPTTRLHNCFFHCIFLFFLVFVFVFAFYYWLLLSINDTWKTIKWCNYLQHKT